MHADLLLRGGLILDPASGTERLGDVAILDGRIIACTPDTTASQAVDVSGHYVTPGLIDFHAHIFDTGTDIGLPVDAMALPCGVTTVVDAGSAGFSTYRSFAARLRDTVTRTFAYLNVCPVGLGTMKFHENLDPKGLDEGRIRETLALSGGHLLGLKVRQSLELVGDLGLAPLKATVALADKLGCPVVVHTTNLPANAPEVLALLRKGDVYCHVFHGKGKGILDADWRVFEAVYAAQARGVILDAANGSNHFAFTVAEAALARGLMPDIISTDLTVKTWCLDPVRNLPFTLSKYLALGMPLMDILRTATSNPARLLGLEGQLGTLAPGALADVAVFAPVRGPVSFLDTQACVRKGDMRLAPRLTVRGGRIVFRDDAL